MEWHPEFRVGRGRLQVCFTGGHLCGGATTPATYETADPVVQKVIESSKAFRTGRIIVREGPTDRQTAEPVACRQNRYVFEYRNLDDISDFLQFEKGVPLERLFSEEGCFREAERLGISLKKKDG